MELWGLLAGLEICFVVLFSIFVTTMNGAYRKTFFSTVTGKQFKCRNFQEAKSDRERFDIFLIHHSYYASITVEVREWVRDNWDRWNEEQEEWFTERLKASVPEDMIPAREPEDLEGKIS